MVKTQNNLTIKQIAKIAVPILKKNPEDNSQLKILIINFKEFAVCFLCLL